MERPIIDIITDWIDVRFYDDCGHYVEAKDDAQHLLHRLDDWGLKIVQKQSDEK